MRQSYIPSSTSSSSSSSSSLLIWISLFSTVLLSSSRLVQAQLGETICACSPTTFEFELDFSLSCPGTISDGNGIDQSDCFTTNFGTSSPDDTTPVLVNIIQILELNQGRQTLATYSRTGSYETGDTFSYTSLTAEGVDDISEVPGGLQITLTGENSAGDQLLQNWIIAYTNDCTISPIFDEGDSIGWTSVVTVGPARGDVCTAVSDSSPVVAPPPMSLELPTMEMVPMCMSMLPPIPPPTIALEFPEMDRHMCMCMCMSMPSMCMSMPSMCMSM
eukprot:CAMPEP_0202449920 /NCGR_PEP_ID=MMETSP1360-20130828/8591_1 /ASSEMBLY_ACC=CAM_ASM_000848 /TAXON_ID=515479 /ORGANISM="Licmophora paradoxa, Strain CCMP2313" /LENGTH=274 /DNA_ID=CAMNT_0049068001 /DNA_START=76 /DNA_END=897 /DNA_ORIENTATION=-